MPQLRIKNFGPIKNGFIENDGFMEISPVTIICGNQATGKSTIAKLYSTFTWLEKAYLKSNLENNKFLNIDFVSYCSEQKLSEYFNGETEITYIGFICRFEYKDNQFTQNAIDDFYTKLKNYNRPKIMYIPSERNLLSVVDDAENIKKLPLMLSILLEEYNKAKKNSETGIFELPISDIKLQYDKQTLSTKVLTNVGSVDILNSSSGIQSVAPISLVTRYLTKIVTSDFAKNIKKLSLNERNAIKDWLGRISDNKSETTLYYLDQIFYGQKVDEKIQRKIEVLIHFFFNTRFINIVEEPEQNLYPESQGKVLYELLECLNSNKDNQLIITTHSPYILSYLTLSAKAAELLSGGVPADKIEKIVPEKSTVDGNRITIYETKEDGSITKLSPYENIPSDENLLNKAMAEGNEKFAELLDLEQEYCS